MNRLINNAKKFLLAFFILAVPGTPRAQPSKLLYEQLHAAQGLYGNEVHTILQDSRGYLWFGTEKGLNKYDGNSFTVYKHDPNNPSSIVDAKVQSLWEDEDGTLWVGTWHGLERFNRATGTFSHFVPDPQAPADDWINVIYGFCEDRQGTLWLGGRVLKSFDRATGTFTFHRHIKPPPHKKIEFGIDAVFEDSFGNLWLGTAGALEKFDRSTGMYTQYWVDENIRNGLDPDFSGFHWIQKIYQDRSGILWLCTNGGPVSFNQKTGRFMPYRIYPALPESSGTRSISSIMEDESGVLWLGSWGGGYLTYNADADSFEAHSLADVAPCNTVCALCRDRAGTIWAGTSGDGLVKVSKSEQRFSGFRHDPSDFVDVITGIKPVSGSLQNNDVRFIYQDGTGSVSIGTATGADRFDRKKGLFVHGASWDWPNSITGALRSRFAPVVWTGVEGDGINKIVESPYRRTFYSTTIVALGGSACSFFEDRRGILWMLLSDAGVCQFNPRTEKFKKLGIGIRQPFVAARMFIEDSIDTSPDGWRLWIGSYDGLWRYDARLDRFTRFGHDAKDPRSLSSNIVNTIFRDSHGVLWVGTDQGLNRMDSPSGTFDHFSIDGGLPGNAAQGILEDGQGRLWVSTTNAISRFDVPAGRFTTYSMKEVLPGIRFGAGCCLNLDRHEMYFGGYGGFVLFDPDSIRENTYVPPVVITGFKTFDTPLPLDSAVGEKKSVGLSFKENVFSIDFAALNFIHPENNRYAYILEGYDTTWIYCGNQLFARYSNVEPGFYTFRVRGSNNDGVWNDRGTSLAIVITPPWWKTVWFTIGLWLTAIVSMGGTVRYVERRKLKKRIAWLERERAVERERARISQDMHDEVGSSLSEIAILSELAKQTPHEAGEHVEEISERTAELIDNVSEIVWAMNPKNDTLDNFVGHVRRYGVKYLTNAGINCQFTAPELVPSLPLLAEVRRNLFLVVKEALHNIVKHAGASAVMMRLLLEEKGMEIQIEDNGRGFTAGMGRDAGNGLGNMKKRIADIGGTFTIESQPGCGTKVGVRVRV